jgi:hypothetical protein
LAPTPLPGTEDFAAQQAQWQRDSEEFRQRYAAVTGRICGTVTAEETLDDRPGMLYFLPAAASWPFADPVANISSDGTFCSGPLGPGEYYLYFTGQSDEGRTSGVFYPGVPEKSKATAIEVLAGQTRSDIAFHAPMLETYSVQGSLSVDDISELGGGVFMALIGLDGGPFAVAYRQEISFDDLSSPPLLRLFEFKNVLPGRYVVFVAVMGRGWYTRKEIVDVTADTSFVSLQLIHQR